nr:xenopsin 1 [Peronia verruculata]
MSTTSSPSDVTSLTPLENDVIDYGAGVTQADYYIIGSALLVVAILGTTFNGIAIAVFIRYRELRSPTNSFIIALCVCDLLTSAIGAPIPAYKAFMQTYITSAALCAVDAFVVYFLSCTSIYLLAAISMDRYIIIVKPIPALVVTQRAANFSIFLCFFFGFLWAVMPLFGWNEYSLEGIGIACSVTWNRKDALYNSFIVVLFIACFLMPLIVMCFSYISIYFTVRKIFRGTFIRTLKKHYTIENRMVKTVVVMIGVFLVSWIPYAIVSFTSAFGSGIPMSRLVETIPALIAKSSCIWNPVIYVVTNNQFRSSLLAWIPFTTHMSLNPPNEVNSKDDGERVNNGTLHNVVQEDCKQLKFSGAIGNNVDNAVSEDRSMSTCQWKMSTATVSTSLHPSASLNVPASTSVNSDEHDKSTAESFIVTTSSGTQVFVLDSDCPGQTSQTEDDVPIGQPDQYCNDEEQSYMPECR